MTRHGRSPLWIGAALLTLSFATTAVAEQPEDAWITTKVKMALLTAPDVPGLSVNVDTFDGRVTLHGQVESEEQKSEASKRAKNVRGVRAVQNLLAVVPEEAREAVEVEDEALERRVSNLLERDAALDGSDIRVKSVNDGLVLLAGGAQTLSAHRRALENARSVEGVRAVASEIESPDELGDLEIWQQQESDTQQWAFGERVSDAWITTKTKMAMMTEPGLSPLAINVDTRRRVVTLFGIVGSESIKTRAGERVSAIEGVRAVENELQVVPDVAAERIEAADDRLRDDVEKRLSEREALSSAKIEVEVKNAVVRLTGTVPRQRDRFTALKLASGTPGVDAVIDDLAASGEEEG